MYVIMTRIVYTYYNVCRRIKCIVKNNWTICMASNSRDLNPVDYAVTRLYMRDSAADHVSHSDFQPGRSQRQSAHLLGESWPTDHRHFYWSLAWQTEGCGSTEWWTHWTVVLTIRFTWLLNSTSKKYCQYQYTLQNVLPIPIPIQFSKKYCNTNINTFVKFCKLKWFSHNYLLWAIYAISLNSLKINCIAKKLFSALLLWIAFTQVTK